VEKHKILHSNGGLARCLWGTALTAGIRRMNLGEGIVGACLNKKTGLWKAL
jgi:hypothetical protein